MHPESPVAGVLVCAWKGRWGGVPRLRGATCKLGAAPGALYWGLRLGFRSRGPRIAAPQPRLAGDCGPGEGAGGPTWGVERGQLAGPGVLRAPAPAGHRLIVFELWLLARPVFGARHGPSPGQPGALRWRRRRWRRRQGRGTAARSRRPMTARPRARPRRRRGSRPAARHSQWGRAPGAAPANQRPPSRSQPRRARGGSAAYGRAGLRRVSAARASVHVAAALWVRAR